MEKKQEVNFRKSDINGSRLTVSFNSVKQYEQFKRYAAECGEDFTAFINRAALQCLEIDETVMDSSFIYPSVPSEKFGTSAKFEWDDVNKIKSHCYERGESISHFLLRALENAAMNDIQMTKEESEWQNLNEGC